MVLSVLLVSSTGVLLRLECAKQEKDFLVALRHTNPELDSVPSRPFGRVGFTVWVSGCWSFGRYFTAASRVQPLPFQ